MHHYATSDEVDRETVVGDRLAMPRKVLKGRVDANLDALERAAFDPLNDPFAQFRNDQGWPDSLERVRRHRRSRKTERQPRLRRIVQIAGAGDADLAVADVGLGEQHPPLLGVEAQADGDAIENQRWF